jgi:predicted glycosyltransferase
MQGLLSWDDYGTRKGNSAGVARQSAQQRVPPPEVRGGANDVSAQAVLSRGEMHSRRWRIALYSHDTMGLGHGRRNLLLAQTFARPPWQAIILRIVGTYEASAAVMSPGVDCLALPALRKEVDGQYQPRRLGISLQELIALRAKTIRAALEAFEPDVLIVDSVPRGALRELDLTLESLRVRGRTLCVIGLRDVLDDPAVVQREWGGAANEEAIRDYYDAVWVYGDTAVYDLVREYRFSSDVAAKVRYTGYLDQRMRLKFAALEDANPLAALGLPPGWLVLCLVGGGQDGAHLAEAFALADLPKETNGLILTGPFMPPEVRRHLHHCAARQPRLRVLEFVTEPTVLLDRADHVIAMGGYNTICEVLSFEKRALIVPRVQPRREQLIRAERLRDLGMLDVLHPDDLSPRALTEWLARDVGSPPATRDRIDLNGLERLPHLLEDMLASPTNPACSQPHARRDTYVVH